MDKSSTQHPKACQFLQLEHHELEVPPTNTIFFVLAFGDSTTEVLRMTPVVSQLKLPNHYFKITPFKSQFCISLIVPNTVTFFVCHKVKPRFGSMAVSVCHYLKKCAPKQSTELFAAVLALQH